MSSLETLFGTTTSQWSWTGTTGQASWTGASPFSSQQTTATEEKVAAPVLQFWKPMQPAVINSTTQPIQPKEQSAQPQQTTATISTTTIVATPVPTAQSTTPIGAVPVAPVPITPPAIPISVPTEQSITPIGASTPELPPIQVPEETQPTTAGQQVTAPTGIVKPSLQKVITKGSKINMKAFLIGCSIFLIFFVWLWSLALTFFAQNPEKASGVIDTETVQSLLKVFATIFFWFIFLFWFAFAVLNWFRLVTLKNVPKAWFVVWLCVWFVLLGWSLVAGKISLTHIMGLSEKQHAVSTDVLLVWVPLKDKIYTLNTTPGLQLIAPLNLHFMLNAQIREKTLITTIQNDVLTNVQIDCWDKQILDINPNWFDFQGTCLFLEKGTYPLKIKLLHTDRQTGAPKETIIDSSVTFISKIDVKTSLAAFSLNDSKNEITMGKAPQKVFVDAKKIFADLKISDYKLSRDTNGDGVYDITDDVEFATTFKIAQLQTIWYTIPAVGNFVYPLTFRIEQSDVPICDVLFENIKNTTYNIITNCSEENGPITKYYFTIFDEEEQKEVETIVSKKPQVKYDFPNKGNFHISLAFVTAEGKKWFAESETLEVGTMDFSINYDMQFRGPTDKHRRSFSEETKNKLDKTTNSLSLESLPTKLLFTINGITPVLQGTEVIVYQDGSPVLWTKDQYQVTITEDKEQEIQIVMKNTKAEAETKIKIPILINQAKIIGQFKSFVNGIEETVGESPFTVKFDASTTTITDPDDKIVYFSRDFGDGEVNTNTSQGIVEHTYSYNDNIENGSYFPTVTVTTKKGVSQKISLEKPIMVKKPIQKARINIDSHPSQAAKTNESVVFSIRTDWVVDTVNRDFNDGETMELEGRGATEISHIYEKGGRFKIKADIVYDNQTTASPTITLIVD